MWQLTAWTYQIFTDDDVELPEMSSTMRQLSKNNREQEFHDFVRQQIICLWIFMAFYLFAYWLISKLKRKTEREALYAGEEDYFVYRVSVWMCSISMSVSIGSLTLLPFSVIGVELLQLYKEGHDNNYYIQWLSYSLIGSLWNYVFILSNLSLFVLLPFSYFFIESQGFSTTRNRNGITQRVYETLAISALFIVVLLCLAEIVLTIFKYPVTFLSISSVNLPLIYSCVSLFGALLLLISTPYGFARMFSVVREYFCASENENANGNIEELQLEKSREESQAAELVLPFFEDENRKDSDSGIETGSVEEGGAGDFLAQKSRKRWKKKHDYAEDSEENKNMEIHKKRENKSIERRDPPKTPRQRHFSESGDFADFSPEHFYVASPEQNQYRKNYKSELNLPRFFSDLTIASPIFASTPLGLFNVQTRKNRSRSEEALWRPSSSALCTPLKIPRRSVFRRVAERLFLRFGENSRRGRIYGLLMRLRFPTIVAILLVLTTIALMMVAINSLKLLFGFRSLPEYAQIIEVSTRHSFGLFGAFIETLIIIYVMLTSFIGLYSLPLLRQFRPIQKDTSMTAIIINSSLVLVVSSALPVIVNTLGMTTFDLLGAYSSLQWLSSFRVVLAYNLVFFIISIAFLFNQLTASMRMEIVRRIRQLRQKIRTKIE